MTTAKPKFQVKADGYRTRTYSYSNMGYDNALSYACYLAEAEEADNVRFIQYRPDGTVSVVSGTENLLSLMG